MEQIPPPKEVKILETAEDIRERRQQVLSRYDAFKADARAKREKLEDSRRFQYFKRDADELESWILEKLQAASDESYKDPTNLQVTNYFYLPGYLFFNFVILKFILFLPNEKFLILFKMLLRNLSLWCTYS